MTFLEKLLCIAIECDQDILVLQHERMFFIIGWKETVLKVSLEDSSPWAHFLQENWDGTAGFARQSLLSEHEKAAFRSKCGENFPKF